MITAAAAASLQGFSGAEIGQICERAAGLALKEEIAKVEAEFGPGLDEGVSVKLGFRHFEEVLKDMPRMVSQEMLDGYEGWHRHIRPSTSMKGKGLANGVNGILDDNHEHDELDGIGNLTL